MDPKDMPANIEAEASILGAIYLNPDICDDVFEKIKSRYFSELKYRLIYEITIKMWRDEKALDLLVLRDELKKENLLEKIGGAETLTDVQDRVPDSANIDEYVRIVRDKGIRRELIKKTQEILSNAYSEGEDSDSLIDEAENKIFEISKERDIQLGSRIGDLLPPILERLEEGGGTMGLRTHFRDFDKITNGLVGGQLVIIAGRPGVGKSTFAFNIIERIAKEDNFPVGIFSLEMGADLIAQHLLLLHSRVKSSVFRKDFHSKKEHQLLTSGYDRLKQMPIYIDDTPEPSILSIKSRARRWCRMYDLKLIIIDYLQLLQAGDSGFTGARQITNRENEIAFISRSLKLLAKTLNVPIIAISQLNREVDTRQSKKPRLSDLRESGAIEQDADLVLLMSREDYYGESMPNVAVDMNIAKNRTGPQGEFQLTYMKDMFFFDDYSSRTEEESYE